jgi:hypothetical protein
VTAGYEVEVGEHSFSERGSLGLACGRVTLVHRRTRRSHAYVYAALHLGALDVVGACRPVGDPAADAAVLAELRGAFTRGTRLTALLRLVADGFGPDEFDVTAALPEAPDRLLHTAARTLANRFGAELEQLFADHRGVFTALTAAGYPLPDELRAPAQLALARRLEADLVDLASGADGLALASAQSVVSEAVEAGVGLDVPVIRVVARAALESLVAKAVASGGEREADDAVALLDLARHAGVLVSMARAQETVYEALVLEGGDSNAAAARRRPLGRLGAALGLAVGHLGVPR